MAMDSLTIIKKANELLAELNQAKAEEQNYDLEVKQLKKRLEAEKQMISDSIRQTVNARREEIEDDYRQEATKIQEKQKKVRAQRNKAKAAGVKTRIQDETADLYEENRRLKKEMSTRMKQSKVPSFCNNAYYYALYFTRGWKEWLILLATVLLAFLAFPCGIYYLIPNHQSWHLVVIYIVVVLLFFGAYLVVGNRTKDPHIEVLKECRKIRDVMATNRRRIRTITRSIEKDQDEKLYQLEEYDARLQELDEELRETNRRKGDAIRQFNSVTVKQIQQEIEGSSRKQIESLDEGIATAKAQLDQRQAKIKSLNFKLTDEYVPYLGKEFIDEKALKGLAELITSGEAANLTEAKNLYIQKNSVK